MWTVRGRVGKWHDPGGLFSLGLLLSHVVPGVVVIVAFPTLLPLSEVVRTVAASGVFLVGFGIWVFVHRLFNKRLDNSQFQSIASALVGNRLPWGWLLPAAALAGLTGALIGGTTGAFGARSELSFANFSQSFADTAAGLIIPTLVATAAYFTGRWVMQRRLTDLIIGSAFVGGAFGSQGTRWHLLLSVSPLILVVAARHSKASLSIAALVVFFAGIPFGVARIGGVLEWPEIVESAQKEIPFFEANIVVNSTGVHPEGFRSFISGVALYLVPRSVIDKGFDMAAVDFNYFRTGADIRDAAGNVLPGLIGSLFMYGGWIAIIVGAAVFGWARCRFTRYLCTRKATPARIAMAALFLGGLILQVRNLSVGYFVPLCLLWVAVRLADFGNEIVRAAIHQDGAA